MHPPISSRTKRGVLSALVAGLLSAGTMGAGQDRLEPDELVERHLRSIGPAETLAARTSCVAEGTAQLQFLVGGSGALAGQALFFSGGPKLRLSLTFDHNQYRGEDIVFDGNDFAVGHATTEARSPLGDFFFRFNGLIKEGLLGGALSTAWPLLNLEERKPRLDYKGLAKIDDRDHHELSYRLRRGGGGVTIAMFFEPETFRHVRTTYKLTVPAPLGRNIRDSSPRETYYTIEETFSEFRETGGLQMPSQWQIRLSITGNVSILWEWDMRYSQITLNEPVG